MGQSPATMILKVKGCKRLRVLLLLLTLALRDRFLTPMKRGGLELRLVFWRLSCVFSKKAFFVFLKFIVLVNCEKIRPYIGILIANCRQFANCKSQFSAIRKLQLSTICKSQMSTIRKLQTIAICQSIIEANG